MSMIRALEFSSDTAGKNRFGLSSVTNNLRMKVAPLSVLIVRSVVLVSIHRSIDPLGEEKDRKDGHTGVHSSLTLSSHLHFPW